MLLMLLDYNQCDQLPYPATKWQLEAPTPTHWHLQLYSLPSLFLKVKIGPLTKFSSLQNPYPTLIKLNYCIDFCFLPPCFWFLYYTVKWLRTRKLCLWSLPESSFKLTKLFCQFENMLNFAFSSIKHFNGEPPVDGYMIDMVSKTWCSCCWDVWPFSSQEKTPGLPIKGKDTH